MGKEKLEEPLDSDNYSAWSFRFQGLCNELGLEKSLLSEPISDEQLQHSKRVLNLMMMNVKDRHLNKIRNAANAKQAWDHFAATFAANTNARRAQLRGNLHHFSMANGEAMVDYFARAKQLQSDLAGVGSFVPDAELAYVVLAGLSSRYQMEATALTMQDGELSFPRVEAKLLAAETMQKNANRSEDSMALYGAVSRNSGPSTSYSAGQPQNPSKSQGSRSSAKCIFCDKSGHLVQHCRKLQAYKQQSASNRNSSQRDDNGGNNNRQGNQDGPQFVSFVANNGYRSSSWYLDSGATHHITYDKSELTDIRLLSDGERITIRGVKGESLKPTAIGKLAVRSNTVDNLVITFRNVYIDVEATVKVISVRIIDDNGGHVMFADRKVAVQRNGETILVGDREGDLYAIKHKDGRASWLKGQQPINGSQDNKNAARELIKARLWHRRYGHLGYKNLELLTTNNMVQGIDVDKTSIQEASTHVCDSCMYAKQTRGPFPSTGHKAAKPLNLVHMDVCGPMPEPSIGGSRYVATILDDCSGLSAAAFTDSKAAVTDKVIHILTELQRSTGHQVQEVRTDRGGEYVNQRLTRWFISNGIRHGTTVGYMPEQNGAAERLNRTLLEKTRAMLIEARLPKNLWAEAWSTANHLRNLSPVTGSSITPHEAFFGVKPNVDTLRIFGCTAFVHIPKVQRDKLDAVSRRGVMVGYGNGKQYRILYNGKVTLESAVKFDETRLGVQNISGAFEWDSDSDEDDNKFHTADEESSPTGEGNPGTSTGGHPQQAQREGAQGRTETPNHESTQAEEAQVQDNLRYPARERKRPSEWWRNEEDRNVLGRISTAVSAGIAEPSTFKEAISGIHAEDWKLAMDEEMTAQLANDTWELLQPPAGTRLLPCRWVYKVKQNEDGSVERFKARLVAKGFQQREGIDYGELFAPTSRNSSLRALLALAATRKLVLHQLDVSTAFLNGELKEDLWMEQPPGYVGDEKLACKLRKSIYGLKQAPRCWYEKLSSELAKLGLFPSKADPAMFIRKDHRGVVFALVHVDDTIVAADELSLVREVKMDIGRCFKVRDLGEARVFLGMHINRDDTGGISLSQQNYVDQLLQRHHMEGAKFRSTPLPAGYKSSIEDDSALLPNATEFRSLVGGLNYLATSTRPDIAYALSVLSRFMSAPTKGIMTQALGVLRYVAGTRSMGIHFGSCGDVAIKGYSDSDWAGDPITRRSTTGYLFSLNGGAISWSSKLQRTVAASSVEAEYQATAAAVREALWFRKLAGDLDLNQDSINISVDSQGALSLGNNPVTSARSKHIDVQHHIVRERINSGEVRLEYCPTDRMVADGLTKALGEIKFCWCREAMGVR